MLALAARRAFSPLLMAAVGRSNVILFEQDTLALSTMRIVIAMKPRRGYRISLAATPSNTGSSLRRTSTGLIPTTLVQHAISEQVWFTGDSMSLITSVFARSKAARLFVRLVG